MNEEGRSRVRVIIIQDEEVYERVVNVAKDCPVGAITIEDLSEALQNAADRVVKL